MFLIEDMLVRPMKIGLLKQDDVPENVGSSRCRLRNRGAQGRHIVIGNADGAQIPIHTGWNGSAVESGEVPVRVERPVSPKHNQRSYVVVEVIVVIRIEVGLRGEHVLVGTVKPRILK